MPRSYELDRRLDTRCFWRKDAPLWRGVDFGRRGRRERLKEIKKIRYDEERKGRIIKRCNRSRKVKERLGKG